MEDRPVVVRIPRKWIRIALIVGVTTAVVAPLTAAATHGFEDVPDTNTFHADIQWLRDSGVTKGCNPPDNDEFCPDDAVTRGQMSAFMRRLAENQVVNPIPLTAGNGVLIQDRHVSVDTPLRLSDDVAPDADDANASVVSAANPNTAFGTFGVHGEADQAGVGVGSQSAGVKGRGFDDAYGVTGEAGDVSNVARALGPVGVVGRGENRGTYGASQFGSGVFGISETNYGLWAQSDSYRGATGRTSRPDNNYGLYTPDNLFSLNINMAGAMMVVVENGGNTELQSGDVVSFTGLSPSIQGFDTPVTQVARAVSTSVTGDVAGVVASRFNVEAITDDTDGIEPPADIEVTPDGSIKPGEHLLLVVLGPAQVRVQSGADTIEPGDSLMLSEAGGHATSLSGVVDAQASSTITNVGTALESVPADSRDLVWVFVGAP